MGRLVLLAVAASLVVLPCGAASAEAAPGKHATAGPGLSVGAGHQYPWVGVNVAYYAPIPDSRFWLTPYLGAGGGVCTGKAGSCAMGAAVGAMGAWGRTHRVIVDVFYSAIGAISPNLHGTYLAAEAVYGIGGAAGYEYMARSGFFLRVDLGVAHPTPPPLARGEMTLLPTVALGLGYKLW